jgi:hypothetical protein
MHRLKQSLSAMKKSPMSVSQRSICSTRKTLAAAFRLPGAAVVVAEAAEAVAVAEAAEAAAVAAAVAARRGELAGFAKPGSFLTALTNTTSWPGSTTSTRPIRVFSAVPPARVCANSRMTTVLVFRHFQAIPVRKQDRAIPATGSFALRQRSGAVSKMRVLKS